MDQNANQTQKQHMKKTKVLVVTFGALGALVVLVQNVRAGDDPFGIERGKRNLIESLNPPSFGKRDNSEQGSHKTFPGKNTGEFKGLEEDTTSSQSPTPSPSRPIPSWNSDSKPVFTPSPSPSPSGISGSDVINLWNSSGGSKPGNAETPGSDLVHPRANDGIHIYKRSYY